jgi:hypothetical protein
MDGWIARGYDRGVQTALRELLRSVVEDLLEELRGARRILDAGCGPGQFTIATAEALPDAETWGIDLAPTMIELAQGHAVESPARCPLRHRAQQRLDQALARPAGGAARAPSRPGPRRPRLHRQRLAHWFFRLIYPRVFTKALSPEEARAVFAASPFGPPVRERLLLDDCFWLFEVRKGS